MTRETKIGLLVGLAFIIVIGILLSDHMTSTTQPPLAMLDGAAENLNQSVRAPAPAQAAPPPVTNVPQITPARPVPTQSELQPPTTTLTPQAPLNAPGGVTRVEIGGPVNGGQQQQPAGPIAIRQPESPIISEGGAEPRSQHPQGPVQEAGPIVSTGDEADTADEATAGLEKWLQGTPAKPVKPVPAQARREYVAQAGDSLSRMAARLLGRDSQANREAIIAANPSLQKNPDLVVEGRTYLIPQPTESASNPAKSPTASTASANANAVPARAKLPAIPETVPVPSRGAGKPIPVTELVDRLPPSTPAEGGGSWYVVKDNDNLWKIANEQLGSGSLWQQIRELNKDVLKGRDTVQTNMRLRLPAKPVASARAD